MDEVPLCENAVWVTPLLLLLLLLLLDRDIKPLVPQMNEEPLCGYVTNKSLLLLLLLLLLCTVPYMPKWICIFNASHTQSHYSSMTSFLPF